MNTQIKTHANIVIRISDIKLHFSNVRRKINPATLADFKESFQKLGLLQPLVVAADPTGGYTLIAGFTRYRGLTELGQLDVNVTVIEGDANALLESHIAENTNRDNLSFVSSIEAIRRLSHTVDGDLVEVGKRLGFGKKALADRLALTKCTSSVLAALDDHTIKVEHAVILSTFDESIQNKTLEKVITEKWSVDLLRERAGKARVSFTLAKFDLDGCKGCPHNADATTQTELFGEKIIKGVCSNTKCFSSKQKAWLDLERTKQAERVGDLIDVTMVDAKDFNALIIADVGEQQYQACQSCKHNVSFIDNRLTSKSLGAVRQQMCNNTTCHTEKVGLQQPVSVANIEKEGLQQPVAVTNTTSAKNQKIEQPISATLSNKQQEIADSVVACYVRDNFPVDTKSMLAVAYLTISKLCKNYPTGLALRNINGKSDQEVVVILSDMLSTFFKGADNNLNMQGDSPRSVLHELLFHVGNPTADIVKAWQPSVLHHYPVRHVMQLCKESGFQDSYDRTHGDHAFSTLKNGTKSELLKTIKEYKFDWTNYAPDAYWSHFTSKYPTLNTQH